MITLTRTRPHPGNPAMKPERHRHAAPGAGVAVVGALNPLTTLVPPVRRGLPPPPTIVDHVIDVLALLGDRRRRGLISWLAVRYYEGYRPCRDEIADLVAVELGALSIEESLARQRQREQGTHLVPDIVPCLKERHRLYYTRPVPDNPTRDRITPPP
jgi:hypothetical protein